MPVNQKIEILPFRKNIPYYPGEQRSPIPTMKDTTLYDEVKVKCSKLTADYRRAPNSNIRSVHLREIIQFCQKPDIYQTFRSFLENQIEILHTRDEYDQAQENDYENILEKIDTKYAIKKEVSRPSNLKMRLRFETHAASSNLDYDTKKANLKNQMRSIFVKGQDNVFVQEDSSGSMAQEDYGLFLRGFHAYGTYHLLSSG